MTKLELINLLKELDIPMNEGTPNDDAVEAPEVIYFWDYLWESVTASGEEYNTNVTYQIILIVKYLLAQVALKMIQTRKLLLNLYLIMDLFMNIHLNKMKMVITIGTQVM